MIDLAVHALCVLVGVFAGVLLAAWLLFRGTRAEIRNLQSDLASLKRFQQLFFDRSPVGFFRTDQAGNCLFVNHKWREMTGLSLEEALGRGWARVVYPGDSHRVFSEWREMYSGRKNFDCRFRYLNKNGSVFWVWGHAAPLYDEQGELIEYFGSVVDISGLMEVSELLHQRERDLESILTSLEDVVFELNEQNVITNFWTNDQGLLFRRPEDFLGKPIWRELGEVGQRIEEGFQQVLTERRPVTVQYTSPHGDRFFEGRFAPIFEASGEIKRVSLLVRDITQIKRMQLQIEEERGRAVSSAKLAALGEMAAGLAHEINNPIAIISAKCQLIEQELDRPSRADSSVIRAELAKIEKNVQRIAGIIRGLRSFARSGENDRLEWVSLEDLMRDLRELCESRLLQQAVDCSWPDPKGFEIFCRPVQIHQILVNLICNAIDAVENKLEKKISMSFLVHSDGALLKIANSGDPIPEHIREKIWQPFFTTKEVNRGTGLGLSISLGLARDNGMDLDLVPDLTRTEFQLSIPKKSIRKIQARMDSALPNFSDGFLG